MKIVLTAIGTFFSLISLAQAPPALQQQLNKHTVKLPNGWSLSPTGHSLPLGDLPLNMAVSSTKKYIAVTNNGQSVQSIQLIDPIHEKVLDNIVIPKSWYGLKFSKDEKYLYASGGNDNWILQYKINQNKLQLNDSIKLGKKWPEKILPTGIEVDDAKHLLYVTTADNRSLYIIDLKSKSIIKQLPLEAEAYMCLLSPDKRILFISLWGGNKILLFDTQLQTITKEIAVGAHPNEMVLSKNGRFLFVTNANDNSVSIVDVVKAKTIESLNTALYPDAPAGTTSNGLALSANEKRLYVANADNNCLAVFDVSAPGNSKAKGFVPVGWYPTNIKIIGNKLFVTNGKGFSSFANPQGPNPVRSDEKVDFEKGDTSNVQYIAGLFKGTLSIINEPSGQALAVYSKKVYANTPYTKKSEVYATGEAGNPIPEKVGAPSPIKYVFYIIKENRTYDQVLGDMSQGNGDTSLVLFGKKITPNEHAIAQQFVLLDNLYADGEVSADGHNWSTSAYATDYLEKTWPTSYGGRGGDYSAEGNKPIASANKGFIWDYCKRAGISYRTYGEFADNYKPNIPVLKNHYCPYFTSWDQKVRDTTRYNQWQREFDSLLQHNAVPQLNTLRFINDHTEGLVPNRPTPFAHVADNDYAVGLFVEHLSKSTIWQQSVVFIIEDDAQNGPDHVDAHRTTAYVAGGFVKRNFVDHTMYSTSSILHTIELILGLPPMSQYDAAATPMWHSFSKQPDATGFTALPPQIDITEKNSSQSASARLSMKFDFSKEDRAPDLLFNEVIWKAVKGEAAIMPSPKRSAFLNVHSQTEKED